MGIRSLIVDVLGSASPRGLRRRAVRLLVVLGIVASTSLPATAQSTIVCNQFRDHRIGGERVEPTRLISETATAEASSEIFPASFAIDDRHSTVWRGEVPGWISLDFGPDLAPEVADVVWFNDAFNLEYDASLRGAESYNLPADYAILRSDDGISWQAIARVSGNRLHSRHHRVNLSGARYLRMFISAITGSPGNDDVALNIEVRDVGTGGNGGVLFVGAGTTANVFSHSDPSFSELVQEGVEGHYPLFQNTGMSDWTPAEIRVHFAVWLRFSDAAYVAFVDDLVTESDADAEALIDMVGMALDEGRIIVLGAGLADALTGPLAANPDVHVGPSLDRVLSQGGDLVADGGRQPTEQGYFAIRSAWASWFVQRLYVEREPTSNRVSWTCNRL